mmetsp:Transcript_1137/g.3429  ORF Transcript_1137/g.3429 Transcript_1137/m.3429 type:complete len:217 (-) Transcript_1137:407-1057(-)
MDATARTAAARGVLHWCFAADGAGVGWDAGAGASAVVPESASSATGWGAGASAGGCTVGRAVATGRAVGEDTSPAVGLLVGCAVRGGAGGGGLGSWVGVLVGASGVGGGGGSGGDGAGAASSPEGEGAVGSDGSGDSLLLGVTGTGGAPGLRAPRQFTGHGWMLQSTLLGEYCAPSAYSPCPGRMPTLLSANPDGQDWHPTLSAHPSLAQLISEQL